MSVLLEEEQIKAKNAENTCYLCNSSCLTCNITENNCTSCREGLTFESLKNDSKYTDWTSLNNAIEKSNKEILPFYFSS